MPDKPDPRAPEDPETEAAAWRREWVEAYREANQQLVETQSAFQRAMTDAQLAFLKAMESSLRGLAALGEPMVPDAAAGETTAPPATPEDDAEGSAAAPVTPAKEPAARPGTAADRAGRRFVVHVERAAPAGLALSGLAAASRVLVTDEGTGVGVALAAQLQARGVPAEVATEVRTDAAAVIFLGGLRPVSTLSEVLDVHREAFRTARTVARRFTTGRGVFVTVQDTGGDFGLSGSAGDRAGLAGLAGLAKTAQLEWPGVTVRAIDLERASRPAWKLAKVLAEELFNGGPELEVGLLADGGRVVPRSSPARLDLGTPASVYSVVNRRVLGQKSFLVASDDARGVTAAALLALARHARPRILLLGRTPLAEETAPQPGDDEIRSTLAAFHQAGSDVGYRAVDVGDRDAVALAVEELRRQWGPVTGIVHGADATARGAIADLGELELDSVLRTRVEGLDHLLAATAEDPLDLLVVFSSLAVRSGERGRVAEAMAGEAVNKIAATERARRGDCLVKALDWSRRDRGTPATEPEQVHRVSVNVLSRQLVEEIQAGARDQVEVVLGAVPSGGPDPRPAAPAMLTLDVFVNAATHPFLEGYASGGVPALPLALVLEWFSRIARAHCDDLEMISCRDLRELRPVRLQGFYDGGDAFAVVSHRNPEGSPRELRLELYDAGGKPCHAAVASMTRRGGTVATSPETARLIRAAQSARLRPWPFSSIYGQMLGHGPECQVIREIRGVSDDGMEAVVAGVVEMGWIDGWHTDVAALDGGLQLATLWFQYQLGGARPRGAAAVTAVGSYHRHFNGLAEGPIRALLRGRNDGFRSVACNVVFVNENGTLLAELRDVEALACERPAEPEVEIELESEPRPEEESAVAEEPAVEGRES